MSNEWVLLRSLHDWYVAVNSVDQNPESWPAPWDKDDTDYSQFTEDEMTEIAASIKSRFDQHFAASSG